MTAEGWPIEITYMARKRSNVQGDRYTHCMQQQYAYWLHRSKQTRYNTPQLRAHLHLLVSYTDKTNPLHLPSRHLYLRITGSTLDMHIGSKPRPLPHIRQDSPHISTRKRYNEPETTVQYYASTVC